MGRLPERQALPRLYAIADATTLGVERLPAAVEAMAQQGVEWIQVRAKESSGAEICRLVESSLRRLEGSRAVLWVDDRVDVAAIFPVAGVHVGQDDLPPAAVRRVVGDPLWIGRSTHDAQQLAAADADPEVDVIALGPIFPTSSKARPDPVVGLERLRQLRQQTAKPLVAIGGIDAGNLAAVYATGADVAAVLGAVCHGDIAENCRRLLAAVAAAQTS